MNTLISTQFYFIILRCFLREFIVYALAPSLVHFYIMVLFTFGGKSLHSDVLFVFYIFSKAGSIYSSLSFGKHDAHKLLSRKYFNRKEKSLGKEGESKRYRRKKRTLEWEMVEITISELTIWEGSREGFRFR